MTADELLEARAELALLKAARTKRLTTGVVGSASAGGESVTRVHGSVQDIKERIAELEAIIRLATGGGCAIHIR